MPETGREKGYSTARLLPLMDSDLLNVCAILQKFS